MKREIHQWHSPRLNKNMEIAVYGHFGFALLLLPTAAADYLEYERFLLIDTLKPYIEAGKVKVFSINSINAEAWLNNRMNPRHKAIRHQQYNAYVENEVVPFIRTHTSQDTPIITSGASLGALHAANLFFRRPDLFAGTIAMSGVYDLTTYTKGYFDEDVYFNSPAHYLPNLEDENYLNRLRSSSHIHILSGSGDYEDPDASRRLSGILSGKGIPHELDIWGPDIKHDWPTWRSMLPYYIDSRF
jgi:esterase/lipase superfamily enzyme